MARFRVRTLRSASVACAPSLARIHERIFDAVQLTSTGGFGRPEDSGVYLPNQGVDNESHRTGGNQPASGNFTQASTNVANDVLPLPSGNGGPVVSSRDEVRSFASDAGGLPSVRRRGLEYFAREWLSKLDQGAAGKSQSSLRSKVTWERFHQAEHSCFELNQRSKRDWGNSPYGREITLARKIASRILGPFDWNAAAERFAWGPGATTRLTRLRSDAAHKYSGSPHATIGNAILANAVLDWIPIWKRELPVLSEDEGVGYVKIVDGNRVVTVPKNYKVDRTIAIEPDMNIFVQKGIGAVMRNRLAAIGCNLDDQTRNQRLARVGSVSGRLATIDLSMASDTISRVVVEKLIRSDWLEALGQCRSPFGVLPSGEKIFYQKFSSMGNGFTFELETLIFLSLAYAWATIHGEEVDRISVYGDDIITPASMAPGFSGLLNFLGFTVNEKKSYWTGGFRESCGKHYFHGYDITPFYVKKAPKTLVDLFKIHNQLWRYVYRSSDWMDIESQQRLLDVCQWLRSFAPAAWRKPSILDGFGDGAFVGLFDEVCPQRSKHGLDGWVLRTIVEHAEHDDLECHGLLVKSLARLESRRMSGKQPSWRVIFADGPEVEVQPVKRRRYVEGRMLVSTSLLHRQCTGLVYPDTGIRAYLG